MGLVPGSGRSPGGGHGNSLHPGFKYPASESPLFFFKLIYYHVLQITPPKTIQMASDLTLCEKFALAVTSLTRV